MTTDEVRRLESVKRAFSGGSLEPCVSSPLYLNIDCPQSTERRGSDAKMSERAAEREEKCESEI